MIKLPEGTRRLLSQLWVVQGSTLKEWGCFHPFETVRHQLVRLLAAGNTPLLFISHPWEARGAPDPTNDQYATVWGQIREDAFYWYDYSCIPQKSNADEDLSYLKYILQNLNEIVRVSQLLVLRRKGDDYFTRGWCFHEWFTAQYTGLFDRTFLYLERDASFDRRDESVDMKFFVDRVMCGDDSPLEALTFRYEVDRPTVTGLTRSVIRECQLKVYEACLSVIESTIDDTGHGSPDELTVTPQDIHARFSKLVEFIKTWAWVLQPVEPVTDRVAMFFYASHWDALIRLSQPRISTHLMGIIYSTRLRDEETTPMDKWLRTVYERCQRKMPGPRHTVVAFLCLLLMGYDVQIRR